MNNQINKNLIAPCGMDCGVCSAHLREKNQCLGCNLGPNMVSCLRCKLRTCTDRKGKYCYDCQKFPCQRLKHLDQRYRAKYGMSEIANLEFIKDNGIEKFMESENDKYVSDEGVFCVHDKKYYKKINKE
ncbi:MAG: DUF3795 domain-containing protein [Candidatus Berkelbacteria bacterium]